MGAAPLINPTVASQGEMWIMLMQIIPSADAIGQTECKASRAMGARTFVTPVAFRRSIACDKTSSFSEAACGRSGFRKWATRVDHLIGRTINDFATRTREIASEFEVEFILTS